MEPRQLLYFRVIAEEQHFGRASARLRIAQPALSRQVRQLEAELGVELFERLPRGVRLTTAGEVYLRHCREIASHLERAAREAQAAALGSVGRLHIGFIEVAAWDGIVPDCISRFRDVFPLVELNLAAMSSAEQLDAIHNGRIDAGFVYNAQSHSALTIVPLARHKVMLALPIRHMLAGRPQIRLEDLRKESFIGFRRLASSRYFDDLARAFADAGFEPAISQELDSEADMLALVNAGAGLAFVNACQQWRQPPGVAFHPIESFNVELELSLVSLRGNSAPALHHFISTATEGAPNR